MNGMSGMQMSPYNAYTASAGNGASSMGRPDGAMPLSGNVGAAVVRPADASGVPGTASVSGATGGDVKAGAAQAAECATCASRTYQDVSTDAGVSFKSPGKIDPSVSAATVMAHEQEHVSLAQSRAEEKGGRIIASVSLKTAICPECGRVYVAGGEARITTITPVGDAQEPEDGAAGADVARVAPDGAGQKNPPLVMDDGGADLFRSIYKKSMAANYGLFVNARV